MGQSAAFRSSTVESVESHKTLILFLRLEVEFYMP